MRYIRVLWVHEFPDDPFLLLSEIGEDDWETRRIDIFRDGRRGLASATESDAATNTYLSEMKMPSVDEINAAGPEFAAVEISADEFEDEWRKR